MALLVFLIYQVGFSVYQIFLNLLQLLLPQDRQINGITMTLLLLETKPGKWKLLCYNNEDALWGAG
ncbi:hypothetical protein GCM10027217_47820 [Pseudomaricurvus hydrocarbonicus]